jgi:hypothetical protein
MYTPCRVKQRTSRKRLSPSVLVNVGNRISTIMLMLKWRNSTHIKRAHVRFFARNVCRGSAGYSDPAGIRSLMKVVCIQIRYEDSDFRIGAHKPSAHTGVLKLGLAQRKMMILRPMGLVPARR